ncbi:hypothetical protein A2781_07390 [Candidatus Gottesmanbacteria bacterium RIFCSPHIGHO2_01_FULL_42_27]|uniref:Uncharacterized protein n=2 Tax=Candidatus Gottesmaniibacteriota TaxID=1752720 RepID=A0A1F6BJW1_9BACT|nr:MAG: hypothetical protein UV09_C0050G0003 [Candidatus Gottesmanbacteria bacterium GW2011_GWA2_42_18]OGG10723.1 MAG: hypothetical protein A2781_07390 [Candidatus Gottesmanbacteria bacterium RIFCSPHIGHO2_01_FULL_42_27]OGG20135.1 MAG: hypothetical protein A3E72_01090 [Candidatus Gottesmanbacteria bacterium RIFCSPHIGHO2_12_FULL_43_26]OGG33312.1 MAG: hypothetical protein A3G68_06655 [Candidatus Gottesmanbacteria bacterium RIFCSPLOWO2_12_FULL_42_10]OGG37211.1 MAG: hypothetical protein A2968_05250 
MRDIKIYSLLAIAALVILLIMFAGLFLANKNKEVKRVEEIKEEFIPQQDSEYDEKFIENFNNAPNKVEYRYTLSSGEEITIRIPEGVDPPPQAAVEEMYRERKE